MLTEEIRKRLDKCKEILKHYRKEDSDFQHSIITGDKTWVFHNDLEKGVNGVPNFFYNYMKFWFKLLQNILKNFLENFRTI